MKYHGFDGLFQTLTGFKPGDEVDHKAEGEHAIHDIVVKGDGEVRDAARLKGALVVNRLL